MSTPIDTATNGLPETVPGVVHRAAALWPDDEAVVDRPSTSAVLVSPSASSTPRCARRPRRSWPPACNRVTGSPIWAPNMHRVDRRRARRARRRRRARAAQHPLQGRRGRARPAHAPARGCLFTVTDFLGTDYVGHARRRRAARPALEEIVVLARRRPADGTAASWLADFLARARRSPDGRGRGPCSGGHRRRPVPTSSSRRARPGAPRARCCTHGARRCASTTAWSRRRRPARTATATSSSTRSSTPFGLQGGLLACLLKGATIVPHPVFDVADGDGARCGRATITMLPGPPDALPDDPRPPRPSATYDLSSLRLAVTGAAAVPGRADRRGCARSSGSRRSSPATA